MDIFISYSRYDKEIVFPLVKRIEHELNTICWIDYEGIESGAQFEDVIVEAIEASKVVLFMLSDNSIKSKWTKSEVLYAEDEGKKIVPISIDGKGLRKWFKFHFGNVDYIDINEERQYEKLLNDLATWIGAKRTKKNLQTCNSQVTISPHKTTITFTLPGGYNLVLKKDYQKKCYKGEIPIQDITTLLRYKMKGMKKLAKGAAIGSAIGGVASPIGMLGLIGSIGLKLMGESIDGNYNQDNEETFHTIVSELNSKYGINLRERNKTPSDYSVEMDVSEISKLKTYLTK